MSTGELTELDTVEVSLVDRGANRKTFALRKQEKSMAKQKMTKEQREELAKALSGRTIEQISKDLSAVSAEGRQAIMTAIGILANAKAELPDGMLQEIMTAAGVETPADMIDLLSGPDGDGDGDGDDGEGEPGPQKPPAPEDDGSDNMVAAEEYSAANTPQEDDKVDDSFAGEDKPMNEKKPTPPPAGMPDGAKKSLAKAEKDAAEAAAKATALQKSLDAANAKAVELEKQVKVERDARVRKEWVAKAALLKHLPAKADELGAVLKELHDVAPEQTAKLEKMLEAFNTKAGEVEKLLKEIGRSTPTGAGAADGALAQLKVKAAEVRKEFPKMTEAQAFTKALELNPDLYDQYNAEKAGAEA